MFIACRQLLLAICFIIILSPISIYQCILQSLDSIRMPVQAGHAWLIDAPSYIFLTLTKNTWIESSLPLIVASITSQMKSSYKRT